MDTPKRKLLKSIRRKRLRSCMYSHDRFLISDVAEDSDSPGGVLHLLCRRPVQRTPLRCFSQNDEDLELEQLLNAPQYESPSHSPSNNSTDSRTDVTENIDESITLIKKQLMEKIKRKKKDKAPFYPLVIESVLDKQLDEDDSLEETYACLNKLRNRLEQITAQSNERQDNIPGTSHDFASTPTSNSYDSASTPTMRNRLEQISALSNERQDNIPGTSHDFASTPTSNSYDIASTPTNSRTPSFEECPQNDRISKDEFLNDSTNNDLLLKCLEAAENETDSCSTPKNPKSDIFQDDVTLLSDDDEYFLSVIS